MVMTYHTYTQNVRKDNLANACEGLQSMQSSSRSTATASCRLAGFSEGNTRRLFCPEKSSSDMLAQPALLDPLSHQASKVQHCQSGSCLLSTPEDACSHIMVSLWH